MRKGNKSSKTGNQKRKAGHTAESTELRGASKGETKRRAWATVDKKSGGAKQSGGGRGKPVLQPSSRTGGKKSGAASASWPPADRSSSRKNPLSRSSRGIAGVVRRAASMACYWAAFCAALPVFAVARLIRR